MKLELKHLAPYLPYKLKIYHEALGGEILPAWTLHYNGIGFILGNQNMPILRPLSDLTSSSNCYIDIIQTDYGIELEYDIDCGVWYPTYNGVSENLFLAIYPIQQLLFEWHFDVFGLIEAGLAIDINTLKK